MGLAKLFATGKNFAGTPAWQSNYGPLSVTHEIRWEIYGGVHQK